MSKLNLFGIYTLHRTPSKFFIQPCDKPEEALIINRQNGEITLEQTFSDFFLPHNVISSPIEGIIGIKHLINGAHLIVIKKNSHVGKIGGHDIYKVEETEIIPFHKADESQSVVDGHDWNKTYLNMLDSVLKTPSFYFSLTYDLTNTMQRNFDLDPLEGGRRNDAYKYYDSRFLWNHHLMKEFDNCGSNLGKYRLPLVLGFVGIEENVITSQLNWALISRRSVHRAGTRFNVRGIDHEGNVANFVETEQILERDSGVKTSFVQIRGSIPLIWSQKPQNYEYKPQIVIHDEDHETAMKIHFHYLKMIYDDVSVVSLIDSRGHEGNLAFEFNSRMKKLQKHFDIPYHYFDFHKECSKMRWHRLEILTERLQPEIDSYNFFAIDQDNLLSKQTGVIRSNCIDSLDRTNVVQSMIAKYVLQKQYKISEKGIVAFNLRIYPAFMETFKNVWADNADTLSIQYAGTPALKTDFTRTGQRTHTGMLKDGVNSITRYITNNFFDSYRQDSIDLFLGNYEGFPSPLYRPRELVTTSKFSFTVIMLTLIALYFFLRWD